MWFCVVRTQNLYFEGLLQLCWFAKPCYKTSMESCCLCSPELRSHGGFIFRCLRMRRGKVNVLAEEKTMKRRWLLLEKQARVVVVVICKCRCCNVDWAIISLSYLRNKWDLEFGKRSVAYRNNSKKRGLMLDIRPSFCGKLQMCHCCPPPPLL